MAMFGHIVPCGIADKAVTSLRPRASTCRCARSSTPSPPGPRRGGGAAGSDRADVVWRHTPRRPVAVQPRRAARARRVTGRWAPRPAARLASPRPASPRASRSAAASPSGCGPPLRLTDDVIAITQDDARPRPRHGVRGGRLPQHLRVLVRRHRHVHDQRRALHPGLRVLPGRHPPPAAHRPRRARAGRRGRRADGPALRGGHHGGPRRPARRRRRRVRRHHPRHPGPHPRRAGRGADPRLQGRPRRARRRSSTRGPTCSTTTSRRWPASSGPCARRPATPAVARGAGPGQGRRAHHQVAHHRRAWARRRRGASRRWPTWPASASTSSPSASTCGPRRTTCRWPAGGRPTSSPALKVAGEALGIGHVEASPLTRSSYHARQAADAASAPVPIAITARG